MNLKSQKKTFLYPGNLESDSIIFRKLYTGDHEAEIPIKRVGKAEMMSSLQHKGAGSPTDADALVSPTLPQTSASVFGT